MKSTVLTLTILINILFLNIIMAGAKNELKLSYGYLAAKFIIHSFNFSSCMNTHLYIYKSG